MKFSCRLQGPRSLAFAALTIAVCAQALTALPARAGSDCYDNFTANDKASSYHMTMTSARGTQTVDFMKPDGFHLTTPKMEMIALDKKAWMRVQGAAWKPMPMAFDMADLTSTAKAIVEKNRAGDTCVDAGMGAYGGRPAHIFKGAHTGASGPSTGTIYVFSDGYVHHIDAVTPRGPMTLDFSGFNSTSISPPN